jgi:uncharacterized protein (DUF2252 family)
MLTVDPVRLARRQLEIDRARTTRYEHLLAHKVARMSSSPLALLRGAAPLFYEVLDRHPVLTDGPPGEGWLVGDAHLENFGAFRTGALTTDESQTTRQAERVVFDLNDFDDAIVGPWRFDVLRLTTALILGGRELGTGGPHTLELCEALIDAYANSAFHRKRPPTPPRVVDALVDKVQTRTRKELLDQRTHLLHGERRFMRGPRYEDLPKKTRARAERAFAKYIKRLPERDRMHPDAFQVIDMAFRVAGTGSLGCTRVAVLVRGKGGPDGAWIFDMKEEDVPSAARIVGTPSLPPGERVCEGIQSCLTRPPRMIGTTKLRGLSMFVRRLAPQEDKIELVKLKSDDLEPLARHMGALLGTAHRRGATRAAKKPWSAKDRAGIVSRAIALAAMHEGLYLAFSDLTRR